MADNFYTQLIADIEDLIAREMYEMADEVIQDELGMPYVPGEVLKKLESLRKEIKPFLIKEKKMVMLSEEQVAEYLRSSGEKQYHALNFLQAVNARNYLEVIQDYLLYDSADRLIVSILLETCQKQGINEPISYYHNGERKVCVPSKLQDMFETETFTLCWQTLKDILENQNPSFLKQCQQVLIQYTYLNYPEQIRCEGDILAYSIIAYVYAAYDDYEGYRGFVETFDIDEEKLIDIII